jgi:hypothetical protein
MIVQKRKTSVHDWENNVSAANIVQCACTHRVESNAVCVPYSMSETHLIGHCVQSWHMFPLTLLLEG